MSNYFNDIDDNNNIYKQFLLTECKIIKLRLKPTFLI